MRNFFKGGRSVGGIVEPVADFPESLVPAVRLVLENSQHPLFPCLLPGADAVAIEQLYRGLDGLESPVTISIQVDLAQYTHLVVEEEWPSLRRGQPLKQADRLIDRILRNVFRLINEGNGSRLASILLPHLRRG